MGRLDVIQVRMAELEEEAAKLSKWGADRFSNGTVLKFKYQFTEGGIFYTYAALKARGNWFLTGSRNDNYLTWDGLVEFLARANAIKGLKMATEWEGLDGQG